MSAGTYDVTVQPRGPALGDERRRNQRQWWSVITALLVVAVFIEAVFAGAMLSGFDWARAAHSVTAAILIASTITAGLVSVVTLRRISHGPKLGLILLSLAATVCLQAVLGALSAKGDNLLWAHVPLGVASFGIAVRAAAGARRLHGQ